MEEIGPEVLGLGTPCEAAGSVGAVKTNYAVPVIEWRCRDRVFVLGTRTLVIGVLNVTPDSFSDGGRYAAADTALARAGQMIAEGADIVDVGGESSRPGAEPIPAEIELARVLPVIERLARDGRCAISVDTRKAVVARAALERGAHIVNDISAMGDPEMAEVVRGAGAGVILMHMQGEPRTMQDNPRYGDVVADVRAFLSKRLEAALGAGIRAEAVAVDPGFGFGKTLEHNLELMARLPELASLGRPLVVGVSRKRMLGALTGRPVEDRLSAGLAALTVCVLQGAHGVRVHDVKESCDAVRVADRLYSEIRRACPPGSSN